MRYPVLIEPGTDTTAFGVVVPDLPGCFSAGDSLDEALAAAEEAAAAWIDAALDAGEPVPPPGSLESWRSEPAYAGWLVGVITVTPDLLEDTTERVNITLPRRVLHRLDALARARRKPLRRHRAADSDPAAARRLTPEFTPTPPPAPAARRARA